MYRNGRYIALLGVTIAAGWYLFENSVVSRAATLISDASVVVLIAAFAVRVVADVSRTVRFRPFFHLESPAPYDLFRVAVLLGFFNQVLPMRIGEISLPIMLKRTTGLELPQGIGILLSVRAFDVVVVLALGGGAILVAPHHFDSLISRFGLPLLGLGALIVAPFLPWLAGQTQSFVLATLVRWPKFASSIGGLFDGLLKLRSYPRFFIVLAATFAVWALTAVSCHLAIVSTLGGIEIQQTALAISLMALSLLVPLQGVGGIGPNIAAYAYGLNVFGTPWETALVAATIVQTFLLASALASALLVGIAYVVWRR